MNSTAITTRSGAQKAKIQTRSMQKNSAERKPSAALLEAKRKAKEKLGEKTMDSTTMKDIYSNAMSATNNVRGETGVIYDERMTQHHCLWDDGYPECPERFTSVLNRCQELNLIERCKKLTPRSATKDQVLTKHTEDQFNILKETSGSTNEEELEDLSSHYDAIYIHPTSFDLSLLSVGSTIELVDNILQNNVQNGMAIIRPPGHHAMKAEYNGYCFFNNVAIAAQHALDNCGTKKILIVDWDVHHGQGTQRMFYNDPRVLFFSIHRYEHGTFWPNLRESDFDYIGEGPGIGYNFNLPLNKTGMTNADYLAIFQQILLPVAVEFQPELIMVSAGYDAAVGCPEFCPDLVIVSAGYDSAMGDEKGEMEITPACYAHLLSPLMALAQGRVAVILEGGYCLDSLAEGAALTLRTLLGDPCPLMQPLPPPCDIVHETILNCIYTHRPYWKTLQIQDTYSLEDMNNVNPQPDLHQVVQLFKGGAPLPERFETRNCYPIQSPEFKKEIAEKLRILQKFTNLSVPSNRVCFVYDELMLEHRNMFEEGHPEQPRRISKIVEIFKEYNLMNRLKCITSRSATNDELSLAHTKEHINVIRNAAEREDLKEFGESFNSVYFHRKTFDCATVAAGSVLQVIDNVLEGKSRSGVCVIRPPGHHAESDKPHGFCIFNNVSVGAQYAVRKYGLKRVLIVDWDVHHGQGTQHIFANNPNVLYISVHRYDNATFFPKSEDANFNVVGTGLGEGFNVNIPWNKKGMGDIEYMTVFQHIIMPIAYEFNPELVLVSAGFDAAVGDPLGGCKVTPEAYGFFTHWLSSLANGKIILCLEGGYNVSSISYAMTMCTKALLGDPLPILQISAKSHELNASCLETIRNVVSVQMKYWKTLRFYQKLPEVKNYKGESETKKEKQLNMLFDKLSINNLVPTDADSSSSADPSSASSPSKDDNIEPGPSSSKPRESNKTLTEYLSENMQALLNEDMYAVVPLKSCPHLSELKPEEAPDALDVNTPCEECQSPAENWVCLKCFKVGCGRYVMEHMKNHCTSPDNMNHSLALSFSDLSVWCYKCEAYIDNPILYKFKNLAHQNKFGEELVWSYGSIQESDTIYLM